MSEAEKTNLKYVAKLKELELKNFYGKLTLSFQNGKIVNASINESIKL